MSRPCGQGDSEIVAIVVVNQRGDHKEMEAELTV